MTWHDVFYNSKPFNLNITISDDVAINAVIEELLPKIKLEPKDRNKKYLEVLILNVFSNWKMKSDMWTGFHSGVNNYKQKSRYNGNNISKKIIEIKELLLKHGYLIQSGYLNSHAKHKKSYTARLKPTENLLGIINKHKMDFNKIEMLPDVECIILKKKQGKNNIEIEYEDAPDILINRENLIAYNNLLRSTHIDCVDIPEEKGIIIGKNKYPILVSQKNKWVKRIFIKENNELLYGRFHGGFWQQMNREWRDKIQINGLDTTEIDYSGMGINTLYDINNLEKDDKDPYDLTGFYNSNKYTMEELRPLLKQLLMVMINSKSSVEARYSVQKDMNDADNNFPNDIELRPLMKAFQERHKPIKHLFFKSLGNLQYFLDSSVCADVINHFTFKNIPVLTVHDSFVIDVSNGGELKEVMVDYYATNLKNYKKDIKVTLENKQYAEVMARRNLILPEPSNPVEEMHQFHQQQYVSPNATKHTINDYYIEDGIGWGFKRLFKDKEYKQRLLDWRKLKIWKTDREYYFNKNRLLH
jgi:hypothetical protein